MSGLEKTEQLVSVPVVLFDQVVKLADVWGDCAKSITKSQMCVCVWVTWAMFRKLQLWWSLVPQSNYSIAIRSLFLQKRMKKQSNRKACGQSNRHQREPGSPTPRL